jgi:hypothetical protein
VPTLHQEFRSRANTKACWTAYFFRPRCVRENSCRSVVGGAVIITLPLAHDAFRDVFDALSDETLCIAQGASSNHPDAPRCDDVVDH